MAGGHENHAQRRKANHEEEALSSTPDIEDLGQRDVDRGGHGARHNANDRNERVGVKVTAGVGNQVVENLALEPIGEVQEPHPEWRTC